MQPVVVSHGIRQMAQARKGTVTPCPTVPVQGGRYDAIFQLISWLGSEYSFIACHSVSGEQRLPVHLLKSVVPICLPGCLAWQPARSPNTTRSCSRSRQDCIQEQKNFKGAPFSRHADYSACPKPPTGRQICLFPERGLFRVPSEARGRFWTIECARA